MESGASQLTEACLAHLQREEQALQATFDTLGVVRAAALTGNVPGLEALLGRQEEAARVTRELCNERDYLRQRIATLLRIPATEATLEGLAGYLGDPSAANLRLAARRVRELAERVDKLNLSNATILKYCLGFTRRILHDFTGGGTPAESYGSDGTLKASACGSFLSARG
jgi:flagellar biosynthesis/type III secretory pathway chaperone